MQELLQRIADENRDLKSELEVRDKLTKRNESKRPTETRREKIIDQPPPR